MHYVSFSLLFIPCEILSFYRTAKKGGILLTICIGNSMICSDICRKYHLLTARCQIKAFK